MMATLSPMLLAFADGPVPVPEPTALALRYYRSGVLLWWLGQAWIIAFPALVLLTGMSSRMRSLVERKGRPRLVSAGLFGVMYVTLYVVASLPLAFYAGYARPHEYGLSPPSYTGLHWLADEAKELGIAAALASLILPPCYLALRKLPRAWPWAVTAGYVPVAFALMFLAPIVVDPLFNTFGPMRNKALEAEILAMAARAGIDGGRVFEADMSKRTEVVNGYVKGFLGSKRIVLYDTLLRRLDDRQVLFVMGHEMGHYALGHVVRSLALGTLGVLVLTLYLRWVGTIAIASFGPRFGFSRLDDVASLPLLLVLGNLFMLAASPVGLAYSRYQEHEADRFALELTRDNRAGALAFVAMQHQNLSNPRPGPLSILWRSTHPTLAERIEFCNAYRPWDNDAPRRYESLFRDPWPLNS